MLFISPLAIGSEISSLDTCYSIIIVVFVAINLNYTLCQIICHTL